MNKNILKIILDSKEICASFFLENLFMKDLLDIEVNKEKNKVAAAEC